MSQDGLALFDTPPDGRQRRIAFAIVVAQVLLLPVFFAVRDVPLPRVASFIPIVDSILAIGDLITFIMLFAQAAVFRSRALVVIAGCFLFMAMLFAVHGLTFPGAFAPDGLLGAGINSTAWLTFCRRSALPIAVILYVLLRRRDEAAPPATPPRLGIVILVVVLMAAAVTLVATAGHDLLPNFYLANSTIYNGVTFTSERAMEALLVVAAIFLFRNRHSILDMWLLVAMVGWMLQSLFATALVARFTAGWYCLNLLLLVSNLVLLLVLIAESDRLRIRLALANAARNRERDARAVSAHAVAGVISHHIGQPLTAVSLNAAAGLHWLKRETPDIEKSVASLQAAIEAGRQATDALAGIRTLFGKGRGKLAMVSLNELIRETAALFARDLEGGNASLRLELDESLPLIHGDRLQLQMVFVNLFANAIESIGATGGGPHFVAVRSTLLDGEDVVFEISDSGIGLAPDQVTQIFDVFYTTKSTGAGLGLSLCRTIVESHGGRLWASPGASHGAVFHLQLPRSRLAA